MEQITLIQPRHVYTPEEGDGHIHLSAPLITAGARMEASGYAEVSFVDENFGDATQDQIEADLVGINLVGAPYIPRAIQMISERVRTGARVLLGGQIIDSLSDVEFEQLFCSIRSDVEVVNGNREIMFTVPEEEVSSIPMWEKISDDQMREYLSREFSFYLSQGCKYGCAPCQAKKGRKEKYRNMEVMRTDLEYLVVRAKSFGLSGFTMYLSNLDILQTPHMIRKFGEVVRALRSEHGFDLKFRGLAGVDSFKQAQEQDPELMKFLAECGLISISYGVDGSPKVWPAIKKAHNTGPEGAGFQKCEDVIRDTRAAGITPEILMLIGYPEDTRHSMHAAYMFLVDMHRLYNAVPRPHLVKTVIPGSDAWNDPANKEIVEELIRHPESFQALDYLAQPSELTHPDEAFRRTVNYHYYIIHHWMEWELRIRPQYVVPITSKTPLGNAVMFRRVNEGRYDR